MRPARRSLATAIGNEDIRAIVRHLMDTSPDTLDSVADKVFAAAERGDFMIIPTRREPMRFCHLRAIGNAVGHLVATA